MGILDDGRAFFDDVKTTLDFQGPEGVVYPLSYLIVILSSICYATPVEQASFPDEWKWRDQTREEQGGWATGGTMGGGQRTGEGPPARGSYNQGLGGNQKCDYQGSIQYQGTGQGGQGGGTNGNMKDKGRTIPCKILNHFTMGFPNRASTTQTR
jgi:hypothetical protein